MKQAQQEERVKLESKELLEQKENLVSPETMEMLETKVSVALLENVDP